MKAVSERNANRPRARTAPMICGCVGSEHSVQFYEKDDFLISAVGSFAWEALEADGTAIVIATPDHLRGIEQYFAAQGRPLDKFVSARRFIALDAAVTLQSLMENGLPNRELFHRHVGSKVVELTRRSGKLHAFGEMVALLWADDKIDAAIQLEEFWNELCALHEFKLLCAYPMNGFASTAAERSFVEVCNAHSRVVPAENVIESTSSTDAHRRMIASLQQKAVRLESEVKRRRKTEEALSRREAELTAFVETASVGLHWVDRNGIIIWANQAELDLLGYSANNYIGRHIAEFHADPLVIEEILAHLCNGRKLHNREARLRCKDGSIKLVLIDSSVLWLNGEFVHTQCFTRDISEQRKSELRSQHLAAIVESSDDAILSKSLEGIITSWNQGAERIFGYTAEETVGRPVTMLIPADRLHEEPKILSRLRRGERVDHFETIRRRKDGSLVEISLTISPIHDAAGNVIGASKIARDITDRRRVEHALEAARRELAQSHEELEDRVKQRTAALSDAISQLEEFSYTVSHDLRAPLRGMQVYSQVLLEDHGDRLDDSARHCLKRISDNAVRLDKMVADVLTYSRVSRGEVRMEKINLDKLVREIVEHYPSLQLPQATVEVGTLDEVWGHEPSLVQIVSNLLSNAVKFVAPGVMPVVRVRTEKNGDVVTLWIQDNGIGINPSHHGRLFRMFERLHPELKFEGTGVGLAIVRKAVTRMGGEVGVLSDGASGTSFWLKFSTGESARATGPAAVIPDTPSGI